MNAELLKIAQIMASKSPVAMLGTKKTLNYLRSKQVEEGLDFIKYWNMSQFYTDDIVIGFHAYFNKKTPTFPRL
jgi:enoyl-CoA hydratase/carnithine racemase